ncbi:hypothetical protein J19TS2_49830 [Cohnella xylanilytica]|uniref:S-layer homology domain-containing protein n=1 Tax=Cohnella xylanilytica TaxID=557555 RepID=UPI001AFDCCA8|nr:S-layer homology domain-containing protein [Cohnella xylanilytica]GIO15428.1 hypothetical protein J19TS2_49830 [Cohnella xylanilytica]
MKRNGNRGLRGKTGWARALAIALAWLMAASVAATAGPPRASATAGDAVFASSVPADGSRVRSFDGFEVVWQDPEDNLAEIKDSGYSIKRLSDGKYMMAVNDPSQQWTDGENLYSLGEDGGGRFHYNSEWLASILQDGGYEVNFYATEFDGSKYGVVYHKIRFALDRTPPRISNAVVQRDTLTFDFTEQPDGGLQASDFDIRVNDKPAPLNTFAPVTNSDMVLAILSTPVAKSDTVTVAYVGPDYSDAAGNAVSRETVVAGNLNPGTFQEAPALKMKLHSGYALKAGDSLVRFTPTGDEAYNLLFDLPSEPSNPPILNAGAIKKTDFEFVDTGDGSKFNSRGATVIIDESLGIYRLHVTIPGAFLQGHTYELRMSASAGGDEIAMPANPTLSATARLSVESGSGVVDEYLFENVKITLPPPVDLAALGTAIGAAQAKHDSAAEGGAIGQYAAGAKAALQAAIDAAAAVRDDAHVTQEEADAAVEALAAAVAAFEAKRVNVDVSALSLAIHEAQAKHDSAFEGEADGNYEAGSMDVLQAAISAAKAVLDDEKATQAQVDAAVTALSAAVAVFDSKRVVVDLAALSTAIDAAQAKHDSAVEGKANGNYEAGSKAALQAAINAARAVLDDEKATQAQVNAAVTALSEAVAAFDAKRIGVDGSALATAISAAQAKHEAAVEGEANGNYEAGAKAALQAAINAAKAVFADEKATQAQVNAAVTALSEAVAAFDAKRIGVDVAALAKAIAAAQAQHDAAVEGGANGNYEAGARAALQAAINAAKAVLADEKATQAQVNAAVTALSEAVAAFDAKRIGVDISALSTAVNDAQAKHDAAVEGEANGNYEAGAKAALQSAINAAKSVLDDEKATQAQVNAAVTALSEAVAAFDATRIGVDVSALAKTIDAAQAKHDAAVEGGANGNYEAGAKAALQTAINAAKAVLADEKATQAQVNAAVTALSEAVAAFDAKRIGVDVSALAKAIDTAQAKHDAAVEGSKKGNYKPGAKAELQTAIRSAAAVKDNASSTQAQVDAALTALNAATAAFEAKKVTSSGGGGSGSGTVATSDSVAYTVEVVSGDVKIGSLIVTQKKSTDGRVQETLELPETFAGQATDKLTEAGTERLVIQLPASTAADRELLLAIPSAAASKLASKGISLDIQAPEASLSIPSASLQGANETLTFTVSAVRDSAGRSGIEQRANGSAAIRTKAGAGQVSLIGQPVSIETNLQQRLVTLSLPITGISDTSDLGVYIEHSDGTTELVRGRIADGRSIEFDVRSFSTFTVVNVAGWSEHEQPQAPTPGKTLQLRDIPYLSGYAGGLFKPNASLTRAEMAAILTRLLGGNTEGSKSAFKDVPSANWAAEAIQNVVALGLMSGNADGAFRPDQPITRAEMAAILSRLAAKAGIDSSAEEAGDFRDTADHWAQEAIRMARAEGWLNGYADGTFRPEQALSRAEAAAILNRLIGRETADLGEPLFKDVPATHWAYGAIQAASK